MDDEFLGAAAALQLLYDGEGRIRETLMLREIVELIVPPVKEYYQESRLSRRRSVVRGGQEGASSSRDWPQEYRTVTRERLTGECAAKTQQAWDALTAAQRLGLLHTYRDTDPYWGGPCDWARRDDFRAYLVAARQWPPGRASRLGRWWPEFDRYSLVSAPEQDAISSAAPSDTRPGRPPLYPPAVVEKLIPLLDALKYDGKTYTNQMAVASAWCAAHADSRRTPGGWIDAARRLRNSRK